MAGLRSLTTFSGDSCTLSSCHVFTLIFLCDISSSRAALSLEVIGEQFYHLGFGSSNWCVSGSDSARPHPHLAQGVARPCYNYPCTKRQIHTSTLDAIQIWAIIMPMQLKGKTAIVTGASTGIGRAIAVKFATEGANVILVARSEDRLQETLKQVESRGGTGKYFCVDLRSVDEVKKFCTTIKQLEGEINIIVNVAGIWHSTSKAFSGIDFADYSTDEILDTYSVGLIAPTILVHELAPLMKSGDHIVNISGTFEDGAKGWLPYFVSKKGIESLTIGLADEFRNQQIHVNCISPSDTASEAYKKYFPQYATPDIALDPGDVANSTFAVISDDSAENSGRIVVVKKSR